MRQCAASADINSLGIQRSSISGKGMKSIDGKDQIVTLTILREIFSGIINDVICANRTYHV